MVKDLKNNKEPCLTVFLYHQCLVI